MKSVYCCTLDHYIPFDDVCNQCTVVLWTMTFHDVRNQCTVVLWTMAFHLMMCTISVLFFLSLDTALPPREDYVQVDCVLKPRYKKCTEKEKIKMIVLKRMYKKN